MQVFANYSWINKLSEFVHPSKFTFNCYGNTMPERRIIPVPITRVTSTFSLLKIKMYGFISEDNNVYMQRDITGVFHNQHIREHVNTLINPVAVWTGIRQKTVQMNPTQTKANSPAAGVLLKWYEIFIAADKCCLIFLLYLFNNNQRSRACSKWLVNDDSLNTAFHTDCMHSHFTVDFSSIIHLLPRTFPRFCQEVPIIQRF